MNRLAASALAVATALLPFAAGTASAQTYPAKPVKIVVVFSPGGPSDIAARLLAERLSTALKQPFVVENKPGAGGNLGSDQVAKAPPDGYTVLITPDTVVTVNPNVYKKMGFDPFKDLVPVTMLASFTQMLVCNPQVGVKTVPELIALARKQRLSYASGGAGVPGHLAAEMFVTSAGIEMTHVPYKGPPPAMTDVVGGQVHCGFLATPTVLPQVKAGKLVPLAVSSLKRSPLAPDVPTMAEAGVSGFDATFGLALLVPKGTPPAVSDTLHKAAVDALKIPDVQQRLAAVDMSPVGSSPAEAAATLQADAAKWQKVVRRINLQLD